MIIHNSVSTKEVEPPWSKHSPQRLGPRTLTVEKLHRPGMQLSERLAFLGIIWAQLMLHLKFLESHNTVHDIQEFKKILNWAPIMPRGLSLSDNLCYFCAEYSNIFWHL